MSPKSKILGRIAVSLFLVGLSVGQAVWYYPKLPETVASHFGASGKADGWMSKGAFLGASVGTVVGVSVLLNGIHLIVCAVARRASGSRADREVTPEAAEKKAVAEKRIESIATFGFWFGTATVLFLIIIFQLAIQANLSPDPVLRHFWVVLGGYLAVAFFLTGRLVVRERRLEKLSPAPPLPPDIWFPAKRFGWGWGPPVKWQGWVAIGVWLLAFLGGVGFIPCSGWPPILIYPFAIVMAIVLIVLCAIKGEKPRWRWGE